MFEEFSKIANYLWTFLENAWLYYCYKVCKSGPRYPTKIIFSTLLCPDKYFFLNYWLFPSCAYRSHVFQKKPWSYVCWFIGFSQQQPVTCNVRVIRGVSSVSGSQHSWAFCGEFTALDCGEFTAIDCGEFTALDVLLFEFIKVSFWFLKVNLVAELCKQFQCLWISYQDNYSDDTIFIIVAFGIVIT